MNAKQDKITPRTAVDIERKYGKKVNRTEKEVESQKKDLASLREDVKKLIQNIEIINTQIEEINAKIEEINAKYEEMNTKYEEINVRFGELETNIELINNEVQENTNLRHEHINKELLDSITEEDIEKWNSILPDTKQYGIGDIYTTTLETEPSENLKYGVWKKIQTQTITVDNEGESLDYTYHMWLRIE